MKPTQFFRRVVNYGSNSWEKSSDGYYEPKNPFGYFTSIACNHCDNPACVANCPTGAMQKDDDTGIVWTDHDVCIGCRMCQLSCPYDAPSFDEEAGYMRKCDMCKDEIEKGRKPACVAGCLGRCLDWGPIDELREKYGKGEVETAPLPKNVTDPNLVLIPHKSAKPSGSDEGRILNMDEELS